MATAVVAGLGTTLSLGVTPVVVAQVTTISGPALKVGGVDSTVLASTFKVMRPTLPDPGTLSFGIFFDPQDAEHKLIYSAIAAPSATTAWKITFTDGTPGPTTASFTGFVSGFTPGGMEPEGNLSADVEITLTSLIIWAP